ncbi:MAG: hypothetical protein ACE14M_04455 [Terriglobales bacterium]
MKQIKEAVFRSKLFCCHDERSEASAFDDGIGKQMPRRAGALLVMTPQCPQQCVRIRANPCSGFSPRLAALVLSSVTVGLVTVNFLPAGWALDPVLCCAFLLGH